VHLAQFQPLAHAHLPGQVEMKQLLREYSGGPVEEGLLLMLELLLDFMQRFLESDGDLVIVAYPSHHADRLPPLHHLATEAINLLPETCRGRVRVEQLLFRTATVAQRSAVSLDQQAELLDEEAATLALPVGGDFVGPTTVAVVDDIITTGKTLLLGTTSRFSRSSFLLSSHCSTFGVSWGVRHGTGARGVPPRRCRGSAGARVTRVLGGPAQRRDPRGATGRMVSYLGCRLK
jgi:hypothetical protein